MGNYLTKLPNVWLQIIMIMEHHFLDLSCKMEIEYT